ncbi:MAG: LysR family transcriptional regulator, partial [Gammaproteobacteria bacterium]
MEIAAFETFLAVAESGSFSVAAERLHLTQPAVSKRIATLETAFGARLFDRLGRRVRLTEAGRTLLPHARALVGELEEAHRAIGQLSELVGGVLRLGTSHHIGLHRLPPLLRDFQARYPAVELDLHFMDSEAACQAVARGELELGIVTLPPEPVPGLECLPVWPDPLDVVAAPDHPLAGRKRVRLEELVEYPAILPSETTYTRQIAETAFRAAGQRLRTRLSTNYLETIRMLVSVGLGWSLLPRTMRDDALVALPV